MTLLLVALLLGAEPAAASPNPSGRPKVVVQLTQTAADADPTVTTAFTQAITDEVNRGGFYDVLSAVDIKSMVGVQREQAWMGCADDTCLTELADAVGAPFTISSSVGRFGKAWQLTIQLLDVRKAKQVGRSLELAHTIEELRARLPHAVAEATGMPPPPEPSRLLPYSLLGTGGVLLGTSGVIAITAFSEEAQLGAELRRGNEDPTDLASLSTYRLRLSGIGTRKTISLVAAGAGIAAAVAGFLLLPSGRAGTTVALVPNGRGVAVVGVFE